MNLIDELKKLKDKLNKQNYAELNKSKQDDINLLENDQELNLTEDFNLGKKIDSFVEWYENNILDVNSTDVIKEFHKKKLRNFIEKIAVWYEIKFPDFEIYRLLSKMDEDELKEYYDKYKNNWSEAAVFNTHTFIDSLPNNEKQFIKRPKYPYFVWIDRNRCLSRFHVSPKGNIIHARLSNNLLGDRKLDEEKFIGLNIKEALKVIQENNIVLSEDNELEKTINEYEQKQHFKEELLNCIMYRIMERDYEDGTIRALIFADEFKLDINIPMMYAVYQWNYVSLKETIDYYLRLGGTENLKCLEEYYSESEHVKKYAIKTIKELRETYDFLNDEPGKRELHQSFVNILSSQISPKELKKEQIKQLRIEKKLKRNRDNI